jgi:hypothetical protein
LESREISLPVQGKCGWDGGWIKWNILSGNPQSYYIVKNKENSIEKVKPLRIIILIHDHWTTLRLWNPPTEINPLIKTAKLPAKRTNVWNTSLKKKSYLYLKKQNDSHTYTTHITKIKKSSIHLYKLPQINLHRSHTLQWSQQGPRNSTKHSNLKFPKISHTYSIETIKTFEFMTSKK